jgi:hypothetical protein
MSLAIPDEGIDAQPASRHTLRTLAVGHNPPEVGGGQRLVRMKCSIHMDGMVAGILPE